MHFRIPLMPNKPIVNIADSVQILKLCLAASIVCLPLGGSAGSAARLSIKATISVSKELQSKVKPNGRFLIYLNPSKSAGKPPVYGDTEFMLAGNIRNWNTAKEAVIDSSDREVRTLGFDLNGGKEYANHYQCILRYKQDNDGTEVFQPVCFTGQIDSVVLAAKTAFRVTLDKEVPPTRVITNKFVQEFTLKSRLLSSFQGKPYYLSAAVLLPSGYWDHPEKKYPVLYLVPGLNGRHDQVNSFSQNPEFFNWWLGPEGPQVVNVFLDSKGPYGDCYQMNSENNGPFGDALTQELMPYIESQCRGYGIPKYRFLDGASTGGWVVLALQIFYPDYFNGAWSYSPDPVDFERFGHIDIYRDKSVYDNRFDYLQPKSRTIYGEPKYSMKDAIQGENMQGPSNTYATSGRQFGAYNAVFSPKGKDGLPELMFDPVTGRIDRAVAEKWKRWDLKRYLESNWQTVGPRLQGKLWIWCGDMDDLYSNVALRPFQKFIESTQNPRSDAQISFTPMAGHCAAFSHKDVLMKVAEKVSRLAGDN